MRNKTTYLILISVVLAIYYLIIGIYLNKLGYFNAENLFYIEKAKIVFQGVGDRLKVMGLTAPILPFYATFPFTTLSFMYAPVIASALGTAILFFIISNSTLKHVRDDFYLVIILAFFVLHPGMLYVACAGKGMYFSLIFFFLFFLYILKFYRSNTTFHVSVASICLVVLTFCDYRFIWLTLFFIPLILSITLQSLNLSEKESIFRLFLSFNSPSLRRKLINKTFALYIIIFILPIASVFCYKLLNLIHANDLNYFIESPYATWNVFSDKLFNTIAISSNKASEVYDISLLLSAKVLLYCPLIILAVYLFRENTYQILTLLTPFAFIEFLRIKYDKVYLTHEFYLIFIVLSLLCIMSRGQFFRNERVLKMILVAGVVIQVFTGYYFMTHSLVKEERHFVSILLHPTADTQNEQTRDIANYINSLPEKSQVLVDDAIAYPIVAYVHNTKKLALPYQEKFLTALETPNDYVNYILVATSKNPVAGYTPLNHTYRSIMKVDNAGVNLQNIYETRDWILYRIK